ncbi:MAG: hypothetical protein EBV06_16165 [Planctomycetia bacterium]|nr:hypothetical protein [Planctomycetia bacterium]
MATTPGNVRIQQANPIVFYRDDHDWTSERAADFQQPSLTLAARIVVEMCNFYHCDLTILVTLTIGPMQFAKRFFSTKS